MEAIEAMSSEPCLQNFLFFVILKLSVKSYSDAIGAAILLLSVTIKFILLFEHI